MTHQVLLHCLSLLVLRLRWQDSGLGRGLPSGAAALPVVVCVGTLAGLGLWTGLSGATLRAAALPGVACVGTLQPSPLGAAAVGSTLTWTGGLRTAPAIAVRSAVPGRRNMS